MHFEETIAKHGVYKLIVVVRSTASLGILGPLKYFNVIRMTRPYTSKYTNEKCALICKWYTG